MVKRDKFIKIMLTEREFKKIERYAGIAFQTKSDFIRSAIRRKIAAIDKSIYPELPPTGDKSPNLRKLVMGDLKDALNEYTNGVLLEKPDEIELKMREAAKKQRKKELERIKEVLEKSE
ncbi:MAG: hypothetical protein EAX91_03645 [Candidatus Lokiarchaeota archaeon]|nr:hypothetical protein [Candidatus Lokiarchaeota archaeon]